MNVNCWFFFQGKCRYGARCRFSHKPDRRRSANDVKRVQRFQQERREAKKKHDKELFKQRCRMAARARVQQEKNCWSTLPKCILVIVQSYVMTCFDCGRERQYSPMCGHWNCLCSQSHLLHVESNLWHDCLRCRYLPTFEDRLQDLEHSRKEEFSKLAKLVRKNKFAVQRLCSIFELNVKYHDSSDSDST